MKTKVLAVLSVVLALAGCSTTDRYYNTSGSISGSNIVDYVSTDAKQRLITFIEPQQDGDGKILNSGGHVNPKRLVCAEPSPDVASAYSSAFEAMLKFNNGKTDVTTGINSSFAESIMQLGKRIATLQLLRDELSDLCRSYANGAVSSATYTIRLSRLDKKMVTLLSSEAAVGAISESTKAIVGAAQLNGAATSAEVITQKAKVTDDIKSVKDAQAALDKDGSDANKTALKKAMDQLDADNAALTVAMDKNAHTVLSASAALQQSDKEAGAAPPSKIVEEIQENYLRADDVSIIMDACLTAMTEESLPDKLFRTFKEVSDLEEKERDENLKKKWTAKLDKLREQSRLLKELASTPGTPRPDGSNQNSTFVGYCMTNGMPEVFELMAAQAGHRYVLDKAKIDSKILASQAKADESKNKIILNCQEALLDTNTPPALKDYCTRLLSPPAKEAAKPKPKAKSKDAKKPPEKAAEQPAEPQSPKPASGVPPAH